MSKNAYLVASRGVVRNEKMVKEYLELFQPVRSNAARGIYRRPHGLVQPPALGVAEIGVFAVILNHEEN